MSTFALALLVVAAFSHAAWNYLLKKSGGGIGILSLSAVTATIALTPLAGYLIWQGFSFTLPMLGMMVGSGVIHLVYFLLLDRAYRGGGSSGGAGDLSVVYPLARATGPLLTIIAATLFFGERMSPLAIGGALLIGAAAILLTGNPAKLFSRQAASGAGFALLCGSMIACYTV